MLKKTSINRNLNTRIYLRDSSLVAWSSLKYSQVLWNLFNLPTISAEKKANGFKKQQTKTAYQLHDALIKQLV